MTTLRRSAFRDHRLIDAAGKRAVSGPISCRAVIDPGDGPTRIGYAISRRIGKASVRNRIRRRVRAAMIGFESRLVPGAIVVFSARTGAADAPFEALIGDCERVLRKTGMLAT